MKKLLQKISIKGVFNTIFPKADNTKIGQIASGLINGATHATPLTGLRELLIAFLDNNGDGKFTSKDFEGMTVKKIGLVFGFIGMLFVMLFLSAIYAPKLLDLIVSIF